MVTIIKFIALTLSLAVGYCDQISYNRLNNNVRRHVGIRGGDKIDYISQIYQWILQKDSLANNSDKQQWLQKLANNKQPHSNKRLRTYMQNKRAIHRAIHH